MGFFKKTRLLFSGINGRIEANILNAFELLEKGISKKKLVKFHKKNPRYLRNSINWAGNFW